MAIYNISCYNSRTGKREKDGGQIGDNGFAVMVEQRKQESVSYITVAVRVDWGKEAPLYLGGAKGSKWTETEPAILKKAVNQAGQPGRGGL